MSFENIGLGGVLSFDHGNAVQSMGRAGEAFEQLESRSERLKHSVEGIGERFTMLGELVGAGEALGLGALIHGAFQAKEQFESMGVTIGTILHQVKGMDIASAMKEAANQQSLLENKSLEAGVRTQDMLAVYQQIVGPMSRAGQSLEQVQTATQGAVLAAGQLGIDFGHMGYGIGKLVAGNISNHDLLYRQLHAMGLIKGEAAEWNALTPVERMKQLDGIMDSFRSGAEYSKNSFRGLKLAMEDMIQLLGAGSSETDIKKGFITPLFAAVKQDMMALRDDFVKNKQEYMRQAYTIGEYLVPVYHMFIDAIKQVIHWGREALFLYSELSFRFGKTLSEFKAYIPLDFLKQVETTFLSVGLAATLLAPAFAIARFALGPVLALLGAIPEVLMLTVGILTGPLGLAIGAAALLFMIFRKNGEEVGDTFHRMIYDVLIPAWEGFKSSFAVFIPDIIAPLKKAWAEVSDSFSFLFDSLSDNLDVAGGDAYSFGQTAGTVFAAVATAISTVVEKIAWLVSKLVYMAAWVKYSFVVVGKGIGDLFGMIFGVVHNLFAGIYNAAYAPIRALTDLLATTIQAISSNPIGAKMLAQVGMDPKSAQDLVAQLHGMTSATGRFGKMEMIDWQAGLDRPNEETPDEDVARKRRLRAAMDKKAAATEMPPVEVTIEDKRQLDVHACAQIDGKEVAMAMTRHQLDLKERSGAANTPWQRNAALRRAAVVKA